MSEKQPGIVILDLDLPGIDGFDLCRRINESDRFGKPSIVVITALEDTGLEERVGSMGVYAFMKKPLDLSKIADIVEKILAK